MRILWAVSSVGKGHVTRDIAIVDQLQKMADVEVDWLAPDPAGDFLIDRGYSVLECSFRLTGSGKAYEQVFRDCSDEFNLLAYIRKDTKMHRHDFKISSEAWKAKQYDIIVGDEAFWLLSGFCAKWWAKPAPFVFLTDFIGVKSMRPRIGDSFTAWKNNAGFTMSFLGPDVYVYIGSAEEIPAERFGFLLPGRRTWAQRHCNFVKPIAAFDPNSLADKKTVRKQIGLSDDQPLFLAVIGQEGDSIHRVSQIEKVFELLRQDFRDACFILVGHEKGAKPWIQYHRYLERLYEYFAASNHVIIQSGYGKVVELSALGVPFIAIPLDHHFEQEYVMAHRLKYHGTGKIMTLRESSPVQIASEIKETMKKQMQRIAVDNGTEVARIILEARADCRTKT